MASSNVGPNVFICGKPLHTPPSRWDQYALEMMKRAPTTSPRGIPIPRVKPQADTSVWWQQYTQDINTRNLNTMTIRAARPSTAVAVRPSRMVPTSPRLPAIAAPSPSSAMATTPAKKPADQTAGAAAPPSKQLVSLKLRAAFNTLPDVQDELKTLLDKAAAAR